MSDELEFEVWHLVQQTCGTPAFAQLVEDAIQRTRLHPKLRHRLLGHCPVATSSRLMPVAKCSLRPEAAFGKRRLAGRAPLHLTNATLRRAWEASSSGG